MRRVAVVDDDPFVLKGLGRLLRSADFEFDGYASGIDFLDALRVGQPACIVLDLHMPTMTGFEVQTRLARSGRDIPVIVITGDDTPESQSRAFELGAVAYFPKPVDEASLLGAIDRAIGDASLAANVGRPE